MAKKFSDTELMRIAIEELNKCSGYPKVGAVVAKDGIILSRAHKAEIDNKHAERIAIEKISQDEVSGATIVTTLEPCVEVKKGQQEISCTDLIISNNFKKVIIGVLDPYGTIYCQGYEKLLQNKIDVSFFEPNLREFVEANSFVYGNVGVGFGPSGERRVAVVASGKKFEIQFSQTDERKIKFRWSALQFTHGIVDLISDNDSVRVALGVRTFNDISDPLVFREESHFARMKVGDIAIVYPSGGPFILLVKLKNMTETDIIFQWQVRKK